MKIKLEPNKRRSLMTKVEEIHPNHVYFNVPEGYKVLVKLGDEVKKNTILATSEKNTSIVSSVAGKVTGCDKVIKIDNNHSEAKETFDVSNIDRKKFVRLLKDSGIIGMGGGGFPTYKKYMLERIDTLIVNAVECEPFLTADYTIVKLHAEEIVECLKQIKEINNIKKVVIAVKKDNNDIDEFFKPYLTKDITLKQIDGFYPSGWERKLVKDVLNVTYNKYPSEKNIVVNNVSTIFAIKRLLDGKRLDARMVTVTGDIDSSNYLVKIGTSAYHLIRDIDTENKYVIIGGPMMGKIYKDEYITPTTNCILVIKKNKFKESPCIRCGKCVQACPARLEPVLLKDNLDNPEKLKKLNIQKCMECGLCSYVCPATIDLRNKIAEAKRR